MPTALLHNPDCELHDTGPYHPESPERLVAIIESIEGTPLGEQLHWVLADPAQMKWIDAVHTASHRRRIEEACLGDTTTLDGGDTRVCPESYLAALLAAGAGPQALDGIMRGDWHNAFICMRPPGHHATPSSAMGFCLFNNIAITARYAQQEYNLNKILIIDWDVHHGNGTQDAFYADPSVLFFSSHEFPLYPGSGAAEEIGTGLGKGYTINCPLPAGCDLSALLAAIDQKLLPALDHFRPDLVLISSGFDAHKDDPLAHFALTEDDYAILTRKACAIAEQYCRGRLISFLEGGYNLGALARSVEQHLESLVAASSHLASLDAATKAR